MGPVEEQDEEGGQEVVHLARELPLVRLARPDRIRRELLRAAAAPRAPAAPMAAGGWGHAAAVAMIVLAGLLVQRGAERSAARGVEPIEVPQSTSPSHARIAVLRSALLEHRHSGGSGREVVELKDGRARFDVEKLEPGERFVVHAGDGEVEVRGTSFDVDVLQGNLQEVVVHEGVVAVRLGALATILRAGDRWSRPSQPPSPAPLPPAQIEKKTVRAPRSAAEEWKAGWRALRRNDDRAAARAFERSVTDGPLAEDAAFWQAVALAKSGQGASARDSFLRFLERYPNSPRRGEAAVIVAWHLLVEGDERAESFFEIGKLDSNPEVRASADAGLRSVGERATSGHRRRN